MFLKLKMGEFIDSMLLTTVEKKAFLYIFSISVLFIFSIIQANVLYIDDIGRILSGHAGWEGNGRPLSSLVNTAIELGKPLTDISPLPQLLSLALYSLSSIYLGKVFGIKNLVLLCLSGIAFVVNPFNIENFCYIFDSFSMSLAVFTATTSFFVVSRGIEQNRSRADKILYFFLSFLLLFASLCFYQAATSIYIAALTFYLLFKLIKDINIQQSINEFILYLSILFISLLAYSPIKSIYVKGGYSLERSEIPPLVNLPTTVLKNLLTSLNYVREAMGNGKLFLLVSILLTLVFLSVLLLIFQKFLSKKISGIFQLILILTLSLFYFFVLTASFSGLSLILANPVWKARTFMGFSAVVGLSSFYLTYLFYNSWFLRHFLIFFLCLLCLVFANVSLTFGNALQAQNTQEEIVATVLLSDLEEEISKLSNSLTSPKIAIIGQLQPSALNQTAFYKYPILEEITISYFKQDWIHTLKRFKSLEFRFDNELLENILDKKDKKFIPSSKPIVSRRIYDIFLEKSDTFVILFKDEKL